MSEEINSAFARTLALLCCVVFVSSFSVYLLETQAGKGALPSCSYLDPVSIDILAFVVGIFLIAEGFIAILRNKNCPVFKQCTRIARVSVGSCIMVIHIIQFAHK